MFYIFARSVNGQGTSHDLFEVCTVHQVLLKGYMMGKVPANWEGLGRTGSFSEPL